MPDFPSNEELDFIADVPSHPRARPAYEGVVAMQRLLKLLEHETRLQARPVPKKERPSETAARTRVLADLARDLAETEQRLADYQATLRSLN